MAPATSRVPPARNPRIAASSVGAVATIEVGSGGEPSNTYQKQLLLQKGGPSGYASWVSSIHSFFSWIFTSKY